VDHERQAGLRRRLDMRFEAFALCGAVGLVVIIIEPALADRDDARMVGGLDQPMPIFPRLELAEEEGEAA
jgi:hypothetical protein